MNANEIESLTDEQATAKVAEALGWKRQDWVRAASPRRIIGHTWIDASGEKVADSDYSPATDIKDAWPLIRRLRHCALKYDEEKGFAFYYSNPSAHIWRGTAPRAIVNAYLWAHEQGMLKS